MAELSISHRNSGATADELLRAHTADSLIIKDLPLAVVRQALDDVDELPRNLKANKEERPIRDLGRQTLLGPKRGQFQRAMRQRLQELQADQRGRT